MPTATICITTFNRQKILQERALKSALAQDFSDYEIIVVDHGSTDTTKEAVEKYIVRKYPVRYIKIPHNSGIVSTARNRGAKEAKGKYLVFLDDDNELHSQFLSKTVHALENAGEDMSAVSSGRIVKHSGYEDYAPPYNDEQFISLDWGWLIKRKVFDVIQYDERMFFNEDADFGLQFTKRFGYMPLNEPLQVAYAHEEGASHSFPTLRMIASMDYFLKKNKEFYQDQPNELRYLYRLMGRRCYMGGWKKKGIGYFWKSFLCVKNWKTLKHFLFILLGWRAYNAFMVREEKK